MGDRLMQKAILVVSSAVLFGFIGFLAAYLEHLNYLYLISSCAAGGLIVGLIGAYFANPADPVG